ncbi:MAG: hypothetical protein GWN29_12935, partial [Gammaproteobacteria bacterium]|nr:hypothetical protein [Gammaproteobacteria bacterium]
MTWTSPLSPGSPGSTMGVPPTTATGKSMNKIMRIGLDLAKSI